MKEASLPRYYSFCIALAGALLCSFGSIASAQDRDTTAVDSLLIQQLEQEMAKAHETSPPQQSVVRSAPSTNPNISVIGDFRAMYLSPARRHLDAELHEVELAAQSVVDPYARADFFFSFGRSPETGEYGVEIEEGYLTTMTLPAGLQLRAGKFRSAFGRMNSFHPHALPFIDVPNVYANYLGEEGLNDEGFSLSWLLPNPAFYQELTIEATAGPRESPSFVRSDVDRFLYLAHMKNFWDLTDNATLELGFTGAAGPNDAEFSTTIAAADVTYKWKPLQFNTYQSLVFQLETLLSSKKIAAAENIRTWGMYALATYQLAKRWFLTGRFDYSNLPENSLYVERAYSATLGWYATEFQKVELEFKRGTTNTPSHVNEVLFRSVFVIGAHGAHQY